MRIEISLSDDTLAKLAKIFAPEPVKCIVQPEQTKTRDELRTEIGNSLLDDLQEKVKDDSVTVSDSQVTASDGLEERRGDGDGDGDGDTEIEREAASEKNKRVAEDSPTHEAMRQASTGKFNASSVDDIADHIRREGWVALETDIEHAGLAREEATSQSPTIDDQIATLPAENNTNQCGWIEGRLSKKLRIDNKKNDHIGEPYWCQKPAGHTGKHNEGFAPKLLIDTIPDPEPELTDDHNTLNEELEQADEIAEAIATGIKTNPDGRTVVVVGGSIVARLSGYLNIDKDKPVCGWWLPAGASYGKFCVGNPNHSDSTLPGDHIWLSPAPQMVRVN